MTTKYPMPEQHVHAELIKAWAEGALIDFKNCDDIQWMTLGNESCPSFNYNGITSYRINPTCEYAKAKIAEAAGDDMVDLYLYWLDGGTLQSNYLISNNTNDVSRTAATEPDPFSLWINVWIPNKDNMNLRKKKRMVKQVLWIGRYIHPHNNSRLTELWENEDVDKESKEQAKFNIVGYKHYCWHKVPSCTREVEVDE